MKKETIQEIEGTLAKKQALRGFENDIIKAVELICLQAQNGQSLYICGNGGSASDSEHIVGEFVKEFKIKRPICETFKKNFLELFPEDEHIVEKTQNGLKAYSLVSQTGLITAVVNDIGGEYIFSQQVYSYLEKGDILFAFSTSGNAKDVLNAIKVAKAKGGHVIGFSGESGGKMKGLCDILFNVPKTLTYEIQELHLPLYHLLCSAVEIEMFQK